MNLCVLRVIIIAAAALGALLGAHAAPAPEAQSTKRRRPLQVAYLHFTLQPGGVERHILNLVRSLDPTRVTPSVVLTRTKASTVLLPEISAYARSTTYFPASRLLENGHVVRNPAGFSALVTFLRRSRFDVAFSFVMGGADDYVGIDAAALAGVPVSVAYVGWTISVPLGLPIDALELPSDVLVDLQAQRTQEEAVAPGYRLARINSPIDLNPYDTAAALRRNWTATRVQRVVVGRVSRLVHEKSPQTFIFVAAAVKRALREAAARDHEEQLQQWHGNHMREPGPFEAATNKTMPSPPPVRPALSLVLGPRFILAGDGPLRQELEELARELGVADIVEFTGAVDSADVPKLLASFDVFLYPTFGNSR